LNDDLFQIAKDIRGGNNNSEIIKGDVFKFEVTCLHPVFSVGSRMLTCLLPDVMQDSCPSNMLLKLDMELSSLPLSSDGPLNTNLVATTGKPAFVNSFLYPSPQY